MAKRWTRQQVERTRALLESFHAQYHRPEFLVTDPLQVAHRYPTAEDREVVALLAAAFASGNIKSILAVLEALLAVLGPRPAQWLADLPPQALRGRFAGIRHRWVREEDIERLMALLGEAIRRHGSLGGLWRGVDNPAEETTLPALGRFVESILAMPTEPLGPPRVRQVVRESGAITDLPPIESILLTSPAGGSACKRMNLFLRWVVRPADGVDLGLWTPFVSPARLVMPVDVHVLRQSTKLGLTTRRVPDCRTALEITAEMRRFSPEDPTRYDFALVRAGIDDGRDE